MTTDNLKIFSIKYLVDFIEKSGNINNRINILTSTGIIEGKVIIVTEKTSGAFPDFINGMIEYYESQYDIDDPFISNQKNTFITVENAIIKNGGSETRLKYLMVYLDEIIGIAMSEKQEA